MKKLLFSALFLAPSPALADGYGFMTPSGNIYCNGSVEVTNMSCMIIEKSGPAIQPRPSSCADTWGHSFGLDGTGPARLECSYKPRPVQYTDIAPYGVSASFGDITCTSETTGLTCRNRSGHGFFLSRARQELF